MLILGLTGSIATGKSTVSKLLSSPPHSLPVIDADLLARQVVLPGTLSYKSIVKYFSPTTPDLLHSLETDPIQPPSKSGPSINRAVLGRRVFGDTNEKKKDRAVLNGIVHPAVRKEMLWSIMWYWIMGSWAVVLDVPLLFEGGLDLYCSKTLFVGIHDEEVQLRRLLDRDKHLTETEGRDRISSQMSVEKKSVMADWVVWNDGGREELEMELGRVMKELKEGRGIVWTWFWVLMWPVTIVWCSAIVCGRWWERKGRHYKIEKKRN